MINILNMNLLLAFFINLLLVPSSAFANNIPEDLPLNFTARENPYQNELYQHPVNLKHITISSVSQLKRELNNANNSNGHVSLNLEDGVYLLHGTLNIKSDYITIRSKSGKSDKVIIQGSTQKNEGVPVLIKVFADHFTIDGITLQNARAHLIQVAGEHDADYPVIRNSILQDSYQQLLKVSYDVNSRPDKSSDFGLIESSIFQYSEGVGPNYYIGGVDLHAGNSWIIRNNKFRSIASPSGSIAQHAIHAWNNSYGTIVADNIIEDCDRGIGLGLFTRKKHPSIIFSHWGGVITGNLVTHHNNDAPFADVGIIVEDSAYTLIENNRVWLGHNYPNAIEYRFPSTYGIVIKNNITNKKIVSRNGGKAELSNNRTNASRIEIFQGD